MISLVPIRKDNFNQYEPMIESWVKHNSTTADSKQNGKEFDVRSIVLDNRDAHGIEYFAIVDKSDVGIVAHIENGDYLEGVLFWIDRRFRGNVSLNEVFDAITQIAKNRGKRGIRFESKIWMNAPEALGFELESTKQDGTDTVCVWRRKVTEDKHNGLACIVS